MKHARSDYDPIQDPRGLIPADEPVFLLRGQDIAAPAAIMAWVEEARAQGADPEIIDAALAQADAMMKWQDRDGGKWKVPDMPSGALAETLSGSIAEAKGDVDALRVRQARGETSDITYAKVGGPPEDWSKLQVRDRATGEIVDKVVEVNSAEGWLVTHGAEGRTFGKFTIERQPEEGS